MKPTIGGTLDLAAMDLLYGRDRHRPTDPLAIAREIRRMYAAGLSCRDISQSLRMHLGNVINILAAELRK